MYYESVKQSEYKRSDCVRHRKVHKERAASLRELHCCVYDATIVVSLYIEHGRFIAKNIE